MKPTGDELPGEREERNFKPIESCVIPTEEGSFAKTERHITKWRIMWQEGRNFTSLCLSLTRPRRITTLRMTPHGGGNPGQYVSKNHLGVVIMKGSKVTT